MMNKKGFTLVELMVVIVIIGVLAAVAIPKFSAATNKAKASELPNVLSQIVSAQEVFHTETNAYEPGATGGVNDKGTLFTDLGVDASRSKYFDYATFGATSWFTAHGVVKTPFGEAKTSDYVAIDESGNTSATSTMQNYVRSFVYADPDGKPGTATMPAGVPTKQSSMK